MKSLYSFFSRIKSAYSLKSGESFANNTSENLLKAFILRSSGIVTFLLVFGGSVWGQVNAYTFSQTSGTYTDITGGTVLITASSNTLGNAGFPDEQIYNISIPFTFTFNGAGYTSLNVSANGFVTFGPTAPTGTNYTPISSTETYAGAISAWGRDLSGMFNLGGRTSTLRWETVGVAPNREVVIQFKNWRIAYSTSTTLAPFFDFQIRLKETTNIIDVIFGPSGLAVGTNNSNTTAQVGLRGANNTFNPNVINRTNTTAVSVNSSTAGTTNASTQAYSSVNATPGSHTNGKIYRWTPPAPPACAGPSSLTFSNVTSTTATISWTAASPAPSSGYEYFYSTSATAPTAGTTPSGSTAAGVTTANLTGLTANTTYYFWLRSNCGGSGTSTWAGSSTFFTGYCQPTGTSGYTINSFVTTNGITNISNSTGGNGGYGNFTAQAASNSVGSPTNFTVTHSATGGGAGVGVWIDWNNDFDFADANEQIAITTGWNYSPFSGVINIPVGTTVGDRRLRVVLDYNAITPSSCPVGISGETEDYTFTVAAPPSCVAPTGLVGTPLTLTSATISWTAASPAPASGYQYYVSSSSTPPTAGTTPTGTTAAGVLTANLTSLTTSTTYYFWVRSVCSVSDLSSWAGSGSFYVGYCVPVTTYGCTDGDVIARVVLNTLDNNSGTGCPSGLAGYSDYTTDPLLTTTLLPSSTYNCTVYAGQYAEGYAAWIDYNDDGVFDNTTERIGYSNGQVAGSGIVGALGSSASFPITLACTPPAGTHRLRVRAMYFTDGINVTPCTSNFYGEVEDYLITIAPAPACPSPGLISTVTATSSSVTLTWLTSCSSATSYDFEYGPVGFTSGTGTLVSNQTVTISAPNASFTVTGLQAGTNYSIYYRANCGSSTSAWSLVNNFTTLNGVSSASSTPTLCQGTVLTSITHTTQGATGIGTATGLPAGVTASWSANVITISGTPSASGVFSYSIPLTGGLGTVSATGTITVLAAPTAPVATSPQQFCETSNSTIASIQYSSVSGSSYLWYSTSTGGSSLATTQELTIGTSTYYLEVIGGNGCVSLTRTPVVVTENPLLTASVSITGTTACPGGVLLFTATPVNGGTSPTYQWYNGGVAIPGENQSTYSAVGLAPGDVINVKMVPSGSCVTVCQ